MTTDDERELAQALFRTLYDAGVSFQSNDLIPRLTATVRAAGFRRQGPITDDPGAHGGPIPRYAMLDIWMALYGHETSEAFDAFYDGAGYAEAWATLCAAIRAHVVLSQRATVVTDDEREALDQIMREADGCWPDAREAILATLRRQGPITDEAVEAALDAYAESAGLLRDQRMRAALEAAERARAAVPSTTEQEQP